MPVFYNRVSVVGVVVVVVVVFVVVVVVVVGAVVRAQWNEALSTPGDGLPGNYGLYYRQITIVIN